MYSLAINTSDPNYCEVIAFADGKVINQQHHTEPYICTKLLVKMIKDTVPDCTQIQTIYVNNGPGSFTGLRAGSAAALGLHSGLGCSGHQVALYNVSLGALLLQQWSAQNPAAAVKALIVIEAYRPNKYYVFNTDDLEQDPALQHQWQLCSTDELQQILGNSNTAESETQMSGGLTIITTPTLEPTMQLLITSTTYALQPELKAIIITPSTYLMARSHRAG